MAESLSRLNPSPASNSRPWFPVLLLAACVLGAGFYFYHRPQATAGGQDPPDGAAGQRERPKGDEPMDEVKKERIRAPELDGGVDWLNCGGPIRLKDLRGKIVLLDFWTYCCINCIHVMPDLAKLEKKYANELVVIGVHSAKFDTEKDSKNIREAVLRYNIEHPVINDANHKIWNAYSVSSWPTFWVIDPEGYLVGYGSGEGLFEALDKAMAELIKMHRKKKTLDEQPLRFDLAKFTERKESPLYFPGKILATPPSSPPAGGDKRGGRLFIADSTHHRIVITDLDGKKLDIAGTGEEGKTDGPFDKATFSDPQGMALKGDTLYVADRKNHLIRALDLKARTVRTVAGTGEQGQSRRASGEALKVGLASPWDLWLMGDDLYIAMAGFHQIWKLDLKLDKIAPFAGSGREDIWDGTLARSAFAQPSGLTSDGAWLYVADSEVSAVRAISLKEDGAVKTLVGEGLFDFGDDDGIAERVRLQHALAVAFYKGKLYVADTYNNKIKLLDPEKRSSETLLGDRKAGKSDDPPRFDEPAGLSVAGDLLYVADTNNHAIRIVDLKTKEVRTLKLEGVEPPKLPKTLSRPSFPNATTTKLAEVLIPKDGEVTLQVKLTLPDGFKLNPLAPMQHLIEGGAGYEQKGSVEKARTSFEIAVPADKLAAAKVLKVSLVYYFCKEGGEGVCQVRSQIWEIPLRPDAGGRDRVIQLTAGGVGK